MNAPHKKKFSVWLVLLLIALIGIYAADLIPAAAGRDQDSQGATGGLLFTVLFCVLLWRREGRNGWWGAAVGLATFFVLTAVGGVMRGLCERPLFGLPTQERRGSCEQRGP
jgi:hypothetical protein